jgi:hypothetical protein
MRNPSLRHLCLAKNTEKCPKNRFLGHPERGEGSGLRIPLALHRPTFLALALAPTKTYDTHGKFFQDSKKNVKMGINIQARRAAYKYG